jgi:hypothetical protein
LSVYLYSYTPPQAPPAESANIQVENGIKSGQVDKSEKEFLLLESSNENRNQA